MKDIILTGDRPTGNLHIGHFVGSVRTRLDIQEKGGYDKFYIMIADTQALTDNAKNADKVTNNVIQVVLDYLSAGIDPEKTCIFIQSQVPELFEITSYFMNLVTLARLKRNPTVKSEIGMRGFDNTIPAGFMCYPISQAADILAFNATIIPVGGDQMPMIEQTREIATSFNSTYGEVFSLPKGVLPNIKACERLPGTDGKLKMSKSVGNCIYLKDSADEIKRKIMNAYTDPNHIKVSDPGQIEGNVVFTYLEAFANDDYFVKYLPEYKNLDELKNHYKKGGLGDVKVKMFLNNILQEILAPIREKRAKLEQNIDKIYDMLFKNAKLASEEAAKTLQKMKEKMGLNYSEYLTKK